MKKTVGTILAGLLVLQAGLPNAGLDLSGPVLGAASLFISVLVAALTFYSKDAEA